jgi:hypothetical protein
MPEPLISGFHQKLILWVMESVQYPIGRFTLKENYSPQELEEMIHDLEIYPGYYRDRVGSLDSNLLFKTYRDGSWNIAQLVHHVADMQLLHYFRMKKALTEADYTEATLVNIDAWANLPDARKIDIDDSLDLFRGVHSRFTAMARGIKPDQWNITYYHPVRKIHLNQMQAIAMASWHVKHHYAHIGIALSR